MATDLTNSTPDSPTALSPSQATELSADPDEVSVADTGAGKLVFVEADLPGKELVGFANVNNWSEIRNALRTRGLGVGATSNLPVFDTDDLPA